jgi:hypothetical protein
MGDGSALGDKASPPVIVNSFRIDDGVFSAKFRVQNLRFYSQIEPPTPPFPAGADPQSHPRKGSQYYQDQWNPLIWSPYDSHWTARARQSKTTQNPDLWSSHSRHRLYRPIRLTRNYQSSSRARESAVHAIGNAFAKLRERAIPTSARSHYFRR